MFGISFTELVLILVVALVVLGPQRLPGMLRTVGLWIHKVRRMTTEVRAQTGIDDLLRQEGFSGGLAEVRSLLRGDPRSFLRGTDFLDANPVSDPYASPDSAEQPGHVIPIDVSRERPVEGPDSYGAVPEDLIDEAVLALAEQRRASVLEPAAPALPATDAAGVPETNQRDDFGPTHPDPSLARDVPRGADDSSHKPGGSHD